MIPRREAQAMGMGPYGVERRRAASGVDGAVDQVTRLARFRERHPEVQITSPLQNGSMPWRWHASWGTGGEQGELQGTELRMILDSLEARFDHRIEPVEDSWYTKGGRVADLLNPYHYPVEAVCAACYQPIAAEHPEGGWAHFERA